MKKILLIVGLILAGIFFGLGGPALITDPKGTLEAFAVRHADVLPLERVGNYLFDKNCASCHDGSTAIGKSAKTNIFSLACPT